MTYFYNSMTVFYKIVTNILEWVGSTVVFRKKGKQFEALNFFVCLFSPSNNDKLKTIAFDPF